MEKTYLIKGTNRDGVVSYAQRRRTYGVDMVPELSKASQFTLNETTELLREARTKLRDWSFERIDWTAGAPDRR